MNGKSVRKRRREMQEESKNHVLVKKAFSLEGIVFLIVFTLFFAVIITKMGAVNMINSMINTAYDLLINTVFYIMAVAVLVGGIAGLLTEFGIVSMVNRILSPLMRPLYGLPGASVVGILTTWLSDNPAILTLAEDHNFKRYFKKYQLPALTNIGTAFGMGLIISTFIIGFSTQKQPLILPVLIGNLGAVIGSIVSTRLMLRKTKCLYGADELPDVTADGSAISMDQRKIRPGNTGERLISALMDGGKNGVEMGLAIIPGVLIICTLVMLLTNGAGESGDFTGGAYEGIGLLPYLAEKAEFILSPLFGFSSPECIAVPITALGSSGAALGSISTMLQAGTITGNDIAVFTSMCMCWSGYLSTHVAMMDGLKFRNLTGHAIFCHTIGGLCAGISAHFLCLAITSIS